MTTIFTGISELVLGPVATSTQSELDVVKDAALVVEGGRVAWVGTRAALTETWRSSKDAEVDLGGLAVVPGFVDCHTHLVFAGDRTRDFHDRCCGVSYETVAARGGGIQTTVDATRAATHEELLELAIPRCRALLANGVTTLEVKSGYGLSVESELRLLEVIDALRARVPQRIIATCLGAHVVPREYRKQRRRYVEQICQELLPEVRRRNLATFVDVYCDAGAFTLEETGEILETAKGLGFGLKVHAGQLSRTGAATLAAELGAVSADHLEHVTAADAQALGRAGTVAVLLPGAGVFLGTQTRPPVAALRAAGVPIALSTDLNPGTSPTAHLPLMATLGCTWFGLRPAEALLGITANAARALSLDDGTGRLGVGGPADFVALRWPTWQRLPYEMGASAVAGVWIAGEQAYRSPVDA